MSKIIIKGEIAVVTDFLRLLSNYSTKLGKTKIIDILGGYLQ